MSELTPHPEIHSYVYMPAGCGVNSHKHISDSKKNDLRRS